jgi:UDPglucose 6-dehydrogenase
MDTVSSSVCTSEESASAVDLSIAPTTPEGSPLFSASLTDPIVEKRLPSLSDFYTSDDSSRAQAKRNDLPDILDAATAAGVDVRNICFIGAGYVGKLHSTAICFHRQIA